MKTIWKIIIGMALLNLSLNLSAQIPKDKQYHLYAGCVIGSWSYWVGSINTKSYMKPIIYSIGGATLAGIGKETWDRIDGRKFDLKDWGATVLGGVTSVTVITGIRFIIKKWHHR